MSVAYRVWVLAFFYASTFCVATGRKESVFVSIGNPGGDFDHLITQSRFLAYQQARYSAWVTKRRTLEGDLLPSLYASIEPGTWYRGMRILPSTLERILIKGMSRSRFYWTNHITQIISQAAWYGLFPHMQNVSTSTELALSVVFQLEKSGAEKPSCYLQMVKFINRIENPGATQISFGWPAPLEPPCAQHEVVRAIEPKEIRRVYVFDHDKETYVEVARASNLRSIEHLESQGASLLGGNLAGENQ